MGKAFTYVLHRRRQNELFKGRPVTQTPRLNLQKWDIMPRIINTLVTAKTAKMAGDNFILICDYNLFGVNANLYRTSNIIDGYAVAIGGIEDKAIGRYCFMNDFIAVERTAIRNKACKLFLINFKSLRAFVAFSSKISHKDQK